jgi:hypothetical protein
MQQYLFFSLPKDFQDKKISDQIEIKLYENNLETALTQINAKTTTKLEFLEVGFDNELLQTFLRELFEFDHNIHFSKID